jgi:DNA segregation ATPase FtsK/SpoIIIE-like protein
VDNKQIAVLVAHRTLALLDERKARLYPERTSFYVWMRDDRAVVIFDTNMIDIGKVNADFAHRLSTRLQGRRVVRTNSRGLYLQVGYEIPPALVELTSVPLDLSKQPTPYHMPIGTSRTGQDIWIDLQEGDSFLLAGSRGMGKSGLIHSFVQALNHGGKVKIYGYDGKCGVEFGRYADAPNFTLVSRLAETLTELKGQAIERRKTLLASGYPNVIEFNKAQAPESAMMPIAVIIDEAALTSDEEKALLVEMVERERDTGFYPIIATNRPEASALLMKSNLVTRISFAVPSWNASQMALGMNGAEALDKVQGRGLIVFKARVTEFQSFRVTYPAPSEEAVQKMMREDQQAETVPTAVNETARILELAAQGKKPSVIIREIWGITGGGKYAEKSDLVKTVLAKNVTSSSTSTPEMPQNGLLEAI